MPPVTYAFTYLHSSEYFRSRFTCFFLAKFVFEFLNIFELKNKNVLKLVA